MPDVINNPILSMYVAAAVALVVMLGFFVYLWSLDQRVRELQQKLEQPQLEDTFKEARQEKREPLRPQPIEKELSDGFDRR
jgi:hypothetical protein